MKSIINFGVRQFAAMNLKRWDETVNGVWERTWF